MKIIHLKYSYLSWTRCQNGLLEKTASKISEFLNDFLKSTPGGLYLAGIDNPFSVTDIPVIPPSQGKSNDRLSTKYI